MPRRAVLSDEQRAALLALPDDETLLVQHWTLSRDDLAIIVRRRRPHNRLGFAIQLGGTSRFVIWTAAVGTNGQQKPERCRKVY